MRLLALLVVVALVLLVVVGVTADAIPTDCPVGQYLCLLPGEGAYILCEGGVLEIHPDPKDLGLYIVFCEQGNYVYAPVLPVSPAR